MSYVRDISSFSKMHIVGDIAVLSTVIVLAIYSILNINNTPDFTIKNLPLMKSTWAKLLGMSVTMLEGVGVILPIKVSLKIKAKESMQDKKDFNKVIIIGMSVVSIILISFPILAFFSYQNNTGEVI